jgi:hypothetical protein
MKIKRAILAGLLLTSFSAISAPSGVTIKGGQIQISLKDIKCSFGGDRCEIPDYGVTIQCGGNRDIDKASNGASCYQSGDMTITSSLYPIVSVLPGVEIKETSKKGRRKFETVRGNGKIKKIRFQFVNKVVIEKDGPIASVSKITLIKSLHHRLYNTTTELNGPLHDTYYYVKNQLLKFKKNIKKSDMSHTERLEVALEDGMKLLSEKSKKTKRFKRSILSWKVQENARIIVAFGMILEELMDEYSHVDYVKGPIEDLRILIFELQQAYEWNNGITGNVSKASATLLEVIRLEVSELGRLKMLTGGSTEAYNELLVTSGNLFAKVNASKSGDMKAQRSIYDYLDAWNSKIWQDELNRLLNVGPDEKGLVIPKLHMLMKAMESMEELTDAGFQLVPVDMHEILKGK